MSTEKTIEELQAKLDEANKTVEAQHNTIQGMVQDEPIQAGSTKKQKEDFVMVQRKEFKKLAVMARKHANSHYALMYMASRMSKTNSLMISQKGLAIVLGTSLSTSQRAVKYLVDNRWLKVVKVATQNAYVLNANVFWRNSIGAKQKVAVFDATIIAFEEEQDEKQMKMWNAPLRHPTVVNEDWIQQSLGLDPNDPLAMDSTVGDNIIDITPENP